MHEITLVSPFPPGRGLGGWGQQSKLKAEVAGGKEGKPPAGYSGGKVSRHRKGQAPRRVRDYATPSQCRPGSVAGLLYGEVCKCRRRSNAGDARGEAPCMK